MNTGNVEVCDEYHVCDERYRTGIGTVGNEQEIWKDSIIIKHISFLHKGERTVKSHQMTEVHLESQLVTLLRVDSELLTRT